MRATLFTRLLAVSLTIAVTAVIATAWLTTRTTSDRLVGEFARTLEADGFVYAQLTNHAASNANWDDVGPLLSDLARRTGRSIALATPDGELLVASDGTGESIREIDVPDVPAALIDPFAPLLDVAPTRLGPLAVSALPTAVTEVAPGAMDDLRERTIAAGDCVVARGFEAAVVLPEDRYEDAHDQGPLPPVDDEGAGEAPLSRPRILIDEDVPWSVIADCQVLDLDGPGELEHDLRRQLRKHVGNCLDEYQIAHTDEFVPMTVAGAAGHGSRADDAPTGQAGGYVRVLPLPSDDGEADDAAACEEAALRTVLSPYVAEPATLYLWTDRDEGAFGGALRSNLLTAVAAVLAVTVGATILAARRLVAPIRGLTTAAEELAAGDRSSRARIDRGDELGRLAAAFDTMAESMDAEERRRREMVSDIAHELRNPLTNLVGYLDAAEDGVVPTDPDLVGSLQEEAILLQRLVDDLQQLALADAGQLQLHREPLRAASVIEQVVTAHHNAALAAGVTLEADPDTTGTVQVFADEARLRQALANLVTNALRYTPAGGRVTVAALPRAGTVEFRVFDTGVGIEPEHLGRLFERFYRADPSRSRATGGSGIGLAIVRLIAEAHGGSVAVASQPREGSMFTLSLPRA